MTTRSPHPVTATADSPAPAAPAAAAPPVSPTTLQCRLRIGIQGVDVCAPDMAGLWRQMALFDRLPDACGLCGSADIAPGHRCVREFEFFSLRCRACQAELPLSRRRDGGLFPRQLQGWQHPPAAPSRESSHPQGRHASLSS